MRALKRPPEEVSASELPALLEGLRPILNTLLGSEPARAVLEQLQTAATAQG